MEVTGGSSLHCSPGEKGLCREAWKETNLSPLSPFSMQAMQSQLYGRSRQYSRPVGAQCSMGLDRNPLINGLIQHTFKLNILFVE